jgi:hypothetical protein
VTKHSDTLMAFLLRGRRSKVFGQKLEVENKHSTSTAEELSDEALAEIAKKGIEEE